MDSTMASDGLPDDRVTCRTCGHFQRPGHCRSFSDPTMPKIPLRCSRYLPLRTEADQRSGEERWPKLAQMIAEVRALDQARNA